LFHETSNPIELIKILLRENQELKTKNTKLTSSIQIQKGEIENMKTLPPKPLQVNLSGYNRIISSLRECDLNSIEVTSSSDYHSSEQHENILNPDDKY
jgi:hypothetical protein